VRSIADSVPSRACDVSICGAGLRTSGQRPDHAAEPAVSLSPRPMIGVCVLKRCVDESWGVRVHSGWAGRDSPSPCDRSARALRSTRSAIQVPRFARSQRQRPASTPAAPTDAPRELGSGVGLRDGAPVRLRRRMYLGMRLGTTRLECSKAASQHRRLRETRSRVRAKTESPRRSLAQPGRRATPFALGGREILWSLARQGRVWKLRAAPYVHQCRTSGREGVAEAQHV